MPCLSVAEKELLVCAGPAEGSLCHCVNNGFWREEEEARGDREVEYGSAWTCEDRVKVISLMLLDKQEQTAGSLFFPHKGNCICFTCPLFFLCHNGLTFSSTKRNVEPELPWFIDAATQIMSLRFPVRPGLHLQILSETGQNICDGPHTKVDCRAPLI